MYFKYVLRKCRKDKCKTTADVLANQLLSKNDKMFWNEIKKINNSNTPVVSTIDSVTGTKTFVICGRFISSPYSIQVLM